MSDERPEPDPGALLRELLGEWENVVNARINEAMATDEFSRNVNQAIAVSVGMQRTLGDLLERYLRLLNLPSRTDVASFDARIRSVEEKLDRILARLERPPEALRIVLDDPADRPPARPPRTRRPDGTADP